jgi:hypothetical protein
VLIGDEFRWMFLGGLKRPAAKGKLEESGFKVSSLKYEAADMCAIPFH